MAQALRVTIIGDSRGYERALASATASTGKFGSSLATLAKTGALVAGAAGVGAMFVTLKRGFSELKESQQVAAQTAAVLKSTGDAAKTSAKQVESMATSLSALSGADDEAIQAGENMLLTFTNIRNQTGKNNDIFNQATNTLTDFAFAMNRGAAPSAEQLSKNAILLGKALNDPVRGLTALRRVGVAFTADQQKQIKALVESGKTMDAQKLILRELNKEFGGSAKAAGETLPGQLNRLKNQFDELAGTLAARLLPSLNGILTWINQHWPEISATFNAVADGITVAIQGIRTAVEAIIPIVQQVIAWVQQNWPQISATFTEGFNKVAPVVINTFTTIRAIIEQTVAVIQAIWQRFGDVILKQTQAVWAYISGIVKNSLEIIRGIVNVIGGLLHGDFGRVWQGIQQIFSGAFGLIANAFKFWGQTLLNAATVIGRLLLEAFSRLWEGIKSGTVAAGKAIMSGFLAGLQEGWQTVTGWLSKVRGFVHSLLGGAYNWIKDLGSAVFHGFLDGLKSAWGGVTGFLGDRAHEAKRVFTLGLAGSPQLFTYYLGKDLVAQLIQGFNESTPALKAGVIKGLGNAAGAIIAAAKKAGVDARAALAVAMTEGGTKFGAVGDKGTSFGPFQLHIGGASPFSDPQKAAAFANSIQGITYALNAMAKAGAAGKTGFDAIQAIVTSFERPANPAAEIAKAIGYYKQIPEQLGGALTEAGAKTNAATVQTLNQIAVLVRNAGKVIGLDHARQIVAGLVEGSPGIVAQVKTALQEAMAAARQAVTDGKAGLKSAFRSLAQEALAAFDATMSDWKPPSQTLLEKMQLEDQINSAVQAVADAQAAVDAAVAAQQGLTQNEGESAADFAARQAKAQQDVKTAVEQLGAAQRSYTETQLQLAAAQEQKAHDDAMAKQREHLSADLLQLQEWLGKHPGEYDKVQQKILKILAKYHIPLHDAGKELASKFADGFSEGIESVIAAARKLANALEGIPGVGDQGGGGGGNVNPGTAISGGHGAGVPSRATGAAPTVTVHMPNYLGDTRTVVQQLRQELQKIGRNNAIDPLAI